MKEVKVIVYWCETDDEACFLGAFLDDELLAEEFNSHLKEYCIQNPNSFIAKSKLKFNDPWAQEEFTLQFKTDAESKECQYLWCVVEVEDDVEIECAEILGVYKNKGESISRFVEVLHYNDYENDKVFETEGEYIKYAEERMRLQGDSTNVAFTTDEIFNGSIIKIPLVG